MSYIPCEDFYEEDIGTIPGRIKRTNPDSIRDRWANFYYSMDLSRLPGDEELGGQFGAWSLGDIPASHVSQIEDDRGNDLIVISVLNKLYMLDWTRYQDEWEHNTFAPIYRMLTIGPIPFSTDEVEEKRGYALHWLKRFRELQFVLTHLPQCGPQSMWRISVGEYGNESLSYRIGMRGRFSSLLIRIAIAVRGRAFTVRLENASNEPMQIASWYAVWDVLGKRLPQNRRVL